MTRSWLINSLSEMPSVPLKKLFQPDSPSLARQDAVGSMNRFIKEIHISSAGFC